MAMIYLQVTTEQCCRLFRSHACLSLMMALARAKRPEATDMRHLSRNAYVIWRERQGLIQLTAR